MNRDVILVTILIVVLSLVTAGLGLLLGADDINGSKCKLPGKNHGDNSPSEKKAEKLIDSGASACEVAKQCDKMEIDVKIDKKKELHETEMYQNAPAKIQKELDEAVTSGHGHDNPNLKCYEIEYAVDD